MIPLLGKKDSGISKKDFFSNNTNKLTQFKINLQSKKLIRNVV